jgi:hypothetical protein
LNSSSLAGDFISLDIVKRLKASHLVKQVDTTIYSGIDNQCSSSFPSLDLNISYTNEVTLKQESFNTTVLVLHSPIDLIIGRSSLKLHQFLTKIPSHFEVTTNLKHTQSKVAEFGETISQDLFVQQAT